MFRSTVQIQVNHFQVSLGIQPCCGYEISVLIHYHENSGFSDVAVCDNTLKLQSHLLLPLCLIKRNLNDSVRCLDTAVVHHDGVINCGTDIHLDKFRRPVFIKQIQIFPLPHFPFFHVIADIVCHGGCSNHTVGINQIDFTDMVLVFQYIQIRIRI